MDNSSAKVFSAKTKSTVQSYPLLVVTSLCALFATFLVSSADLKFEMKLFIFVSVVISYLLICLAAYNRRKEKPANFPAEKSNDSIFDDEIERKLFALEELNQFFGASLKSDDMFRLIAIRVSEIVPYSALTLYLAEKEDSKLKIAYASGENAEDFTGTEISSDEGIAGRAFQNKKPQFESILLPDETVIAADKPKNLNSAIAVPLSQSGKVYGVLVFYVAAENKINQDSLRLFEAVGVRTSPLLTGSRVFEENLSNALVDSLTNLPNERAFYLVLENQVAESQRFRGERPLTILAIDIKDFSELNLRYGHASGDRLLAYAAETVKSQLRGMDFLARSTGDEFLAVLPTASGKITGEIVERIERTFVSKPFELSARETVNLQLNFGAASFWQDGETASELVKNALLRKNQSKNAETSNILWFPKEYVN